MNLEREIHKIDKYLEIIRKIGVREIDTTVYIYAHQKVSG